MAHWKCGLLVTSMLIAISAPLAKAEDAVPVLPVVDAPEQPESSGPPPLPKTPPAPEPAPTAQPAPAPESTSAATPASPTTQTADPNATATPQVQQEDKNPDWRGSIMFNITDTTRLDQFLEALSQGRNLLAEQAAEQGKDFLEVVTNPTPATEDKEVVPTFPVVFLSSILFISPDEWSVWVNGKRINNDTKTMQLEGELSVKGLDKYHVDFVWKPSLAAFGFLKGKYNQLTKDEVTELVTPTSTVEMDEKNGQFAFTLRPNQKLLTDKLKIIEGQTYYTRAKSKQDDKDNASPQEESPDTSESPGPRSDAEQSGQSEASDAAPPGQDENTPMKPRSMEDIAQQLTNQYKEVGKTLNVGPKE